ncbi:hypothetical protein D3C78_1763990 [compost metagenome]
MVSTLNFCPRAQAMRNELCPGASTGMLNRERSAERPESLTVLMHTASKPSASACRPASITAISMIAMS